MRITLRSCTPSYFCGSSTTLPETRSPGRSCARQDDADLLCDRRILDIWSATRKLSRNGLGRNQWRSPPNRLVTPCLTTRVQADCAGLRCSRSVPSGCESITADPSSSMQQPTDTEGLGKREFSFGRVVDFHAPHLQAGSIKSDQGHRHYANHRGRARHWIGVGDQHRK
jgi:hypothetical protein